MNVLSTESTRRRGVTPTSPVSASRSPVSKKRYRVVQGLLVYDLAAKDLYGVELTRRRQARSTDRDAAALLELARTIDPRPLDQPRNPGERIGGRCNTYTLLTVRAAAGGRGPGTISLRVRRVLRAGVLRGPLGGRVLGP